MARASSLNSCCHWLSPWNLGKSELLFEARLLERFIRSVTRLDVSIYAEVDFADWAKPCLVIALAWAYVVATGSF
jgi:hypothetical protein